MLETLVVIIVVLGAGYVTLRHFLKSVQSPCSPEDCASCSQYHELNTGTECSSQQCVDSTRTTQSNEHCHDHERSSNDSQ